MICASTLQFLSGLAGLASAALLALPYLARQPLRDALQDVENVKADTPEDRAVRDRAQAALFRQLAPKMRRDFRMGKWDAAALGLAFLLQMASLGVPPCTS